MINQIIKKGLVTAVIASSILSPLGCASALTYCYFKHGAKQKIHTDKSEIRLNISSLEKSIKMPDMNKLPKPYLESKINCYSETESDVNLSWYNVEGNNILVATRTGKNKPYAVVIKDGITVLDNGLNGGMPEDGIVDEIRNWKTDKERSICYDYPMEIRI